MRILKSLFLMAMLFPNLAQAVLDVVASGSSSGMLVREIAADNAELTILAPPDRDLHYLQARPSMIRALRGADLVLALGADLEQGWLPIAIKQAANPKILPGRPGYFEAAAQVNLLDVGGPADRALGDVHPTGNPHVNMDPLRMAQVGLALGQRLADLDPANAADYRRRASAFADKVQRRMPAWRERCAGVQGAVSYHRDVVYLLERFEIPLLGTIESVPGVPPTAAHLKTLTDDLSARRGVVLFTIYQPPQAPQALAKALGWNASRLPLDPPLDADGDAYLEHIGRWIDALAKGI